MLFDRDLGFSWEHMGEQDFLAFVSSPTPSRNPPKVLVGPKSHGEYLYRYIIQQKAPHLKVETIESPYGIISCDHYQEKIWEKLCQVYLVQDPPELYDFFAESVDHDLIVIQNIQNAMQLDWLKGLLDIFYKKSRSPSHVSFLFFVQTQFDGDAYIDMSRSRPHLFQNLAVSKDTIREEYNLWRLAWETAGCRSTMHMMLSSQRYNLSASESRCRSQLYAYAQNEMKRYEAEKETLIRWLNNEAKLNGTCSRQKNISIYALPKAIRSFFWIPFGGTQISLKPWASRILLTEPQPNYQKMMFVRNAMYSSWVNGVLMTYCLHYEQELRRALPPTIKLKDDYKLTFEHSLECAFRQEYSLLYPIYDIEKSQWKGLGKKAKEHRSRYNEVIKRYNTLRYIRNWLAHMRPLTWKVLEDLHNAHQYIQGHNFPLLLK